MQSTIKQDQDHLRDKIGVTVNDRSAITQDLFDDHGIARCNSEAVFDELHACFKSKWEHVEGLIEYIEKKIFPVILHHMLKPTWYEGTPPMWTNNNLESMTIYSKTVPNGALNS